MGGEPVGILYAMAPEQDASFDADSAVGRYWLLHCEGFEVDGPHAPVGVVEEIVPDTDVGDVLVVRRRTPVPPRIVEVRAERVASVHPWEERIVLHGRRHATAPAPAPAPVPGPASEPRPARERAVGAAAAAYATRARSKAAPAARSAGAHSTSAARAAGRTVRRATLAVVALLAAAGAFLARFVRAHGPRVVATLSAYGVGAKQATRAYAHEARRAPRAWSIAFVAWLRQVRSADLTPLREGARRERDELAAWMRHIRGTHKRPTRRSIRRPARPEPSPNGHAPDADTVESAVTERRQAAS